jgi:hypothetical protein
VTPRLALGLLPLVLNGSLAAQVTVQLNGGYLDRRLADGAAIERQAGVVGGAGISVSPGGVAFSVAAVAGRLRASTERTEDAEYGRISGDVIIPFASWVAASAGVVASVFVTPIGAQRWILPRITLELSAPFTTIPVSAYFASSAFVGPSGNVANRPQGGMSIHAGVAGRGSPLALFLEYHLERLTFETATGRKEQRGEIQAGLRLTP